MQDKCELEGVHLDAEVSRLEGKNPVGFSPSVSWADGGPIIEREKIELIYFGAKGVNGDPWEAQIGCDTHYIDQYPGDATSGQTPLIAAMRAYVESKRHNAKSQATDAALSRQVACTDGLGVAVPPAPTFKRGDKA